MDVYVAYAPLDIRTELERQCIVEEDRIDRPLCERESTVIGEWSAGAPIIEFAVRVERCERTP